MAQADYSVVVDLSTRNAETQLNRLNQQINNLGSTRVGQNITNSITSGINSASGSVSRLQSQLTNLNAGSGLSGSIRSAQSQISQLEAQLGRLGSGAGSNVGQGIANSVRNGVNQAERELNRLSGTAGTAGKKLEQAISGGASSGLSAFPATFSKIRNAVLATTAVLGGAGLAGAIIQTSAQFQDLRSALNATYGSVEAGTAAFKTVQDFAVQTPFDVATLTKAFITLKAQGLTPTRDLMTTFSDASSVTTDRLRTFEALVRITSRSLSGGLGLEELNQIAEAGLPVFDILERKIGVNRLGISELGKTAEGSQKILNALVTGLNERFGGSTAANANNLSVSLSNLGDAARNAFDVIGQNGLGQAINDVAKSITDWINNNKEAAASLGQGLGTAVRLAGSAFMFLADNIKIVTTVLAAIGIGKAVGAIAAFTGTVVEGVKTLGLLRYALAAVGGPFTVLGAAAFALGVIIYKNWDYLKGFATALGQNVAIAISNTITKISNFGKTLGVLGSALASFLSGNLSAFNGIGARIDAVKTKTKEYVSVTEAGSASARRAAQAEHQSAAAKQKNAAATAAAKREQEAFNQPYSKSLENFNRGRPIQQAATEAQKQHANSVKQFTDNLKEQISTLQIESATVGQNQTVRDAAIRQRDAERLGISKQTASLRAKITALQQEKAEKVFAGNFQDYIANMNAETAALSLNRKEREIALAVLQQENAARAAGATLSPAQKAQLEAAIRANQQAKASSEARDRAEDESAQKAIDRQKELQDAINGTSQAYGNQSSAANGSFGNSGSITNSGSVGASLGQAIVDSIFNSSGKKVKYNPSDGTYTNNSFGSQLSETLFGRSSVYSNNQATGIPTFNGSTIRIGNSGQVSSGSGGINVTIHNTGNPLDQDSINIIVTSIAQAMRQEMANEKRPGGLLYG